MNRVVLSWLLTTKIGDEFSNVLENDKQLESEMIIWVKFVVKRSRCNRETRDHAHDIPLYVNTRLLPYARKDAKTDPKKIDADVILSINFIF